MALVSCPKCGKQIASPATKCPHCGELLQQKASKNNVICSKCGNEYDNALKVCPNCSNPNEKVVSSDTTRPIQSTTRVNYERIFYTNENEFDEVKYVSPNFKLQDAKKLEGLEDYYDFIKPSIYPTHFTFKGDAKFFLEFDEREIIEALQEDERDPEDYGFGEPCKGVIVTVDKAETIKLPVLENWSDDAFLIEKEQYLLLCNAQSLQFKIFRENGKSVTIEGDEGNTKLLIDSFRGLYNYVEDKTMFADSLIRLQQWADKEDAESKELERQAEAKQAADVQEDITKGKRISTIGIVIIVVGVILFIIGVSDYDNLFLVIPSIPIILVGVFFVLYGNMKKKGYSNMEAIRRALDILNN